LFLLRLLIGAPNVLILDEPTNDLDVQTLAVLEDYLEDFSGCVIVVSHDRYFLDRTVDKIFALEENGNLRQYPGNYSVYLDYKQAEAAALQKNAPDQEKPKNKQITSNTAENVLSPPQPNELKKQRRLSNWEKREFEQLEAKIAQLETEKTAVEATLAEISGNFSQALTQAIDVATERWLELAEIESE
jgi:ATP-binding cassette subfamily F protein uup